MRSRCRPRHAPPWRQQDDTTRRRRSSTASLHRAGTTMSLGESALTVGRDQACSSRPGASGARAVPNVGASHVEEFGTGRRAPADAIVEFQGDDPGWGPLLRYTIVKPQDQQLRQKIRGRCGEAWRGLPPPVISSGTDSHVIRFRSRAGASHRSQRGKASTAYSGSDDSPVADLSKYECPQGEDDYRHRMVVNAAALVFVSLLSLAGFWLVNAIAHS